MEVLNCSTTNTVSGEQLWVSSLLTPRVHRLNYSLLGCQDYIAGNPCHGPQLAGAYEGGRESGDDSTISTVGTVGYY